MSEPESKLDMTALNDALDGESNAGGTKEIPTQSKPSEEAARETMNKSNTLTINAKSKEGKGSPETLSPGSPSEEQVGNGGLTQSTTVAGTPAIPSNNNQTTPLDPTTQQIKTMFPDIDTDTIQAVVVAEGGDFERAINTLLQMSDPSYVPPPPRELSQTEQDEQYARSLAASEEQQARSQRQFVNPSSARGGALGSLFGIGGQGAQEQSQSPSYDPNNLSYQPRVRRTTSNNQSTNASRPTYSPQNSTGYNGQTGAALPGPREAKQWQDDINKFAEQGFAKAASTFSALRQKGEQAWAQRSQASPGGGAYNDQVPPTGRGGSFFGGWNQRNPSGSSASTASPNIGSGRGFDRDPSPVGENELAKILARGRNDSASGDSSPARKNSLGNIADRYKKVAGGRQSGSKPASMSKNDGIDDDADEANFGWDDAGRTGGTKDGKSFEPIKINDNSLDTPPTSAKSQSQRNAVSLMEGSAGRGITSPRFGSHAESDKNAIHQDAHNNDDDDDDLEYVANPFEDED